jgi:maestro heat-like repeat-containing protein family member 1
LPHLKEILSRTLPILAMIKHDNLRWVFAAALGRWAEAVIVATNDKENPSLIPISEFSAQMHTASKHILKEWLLQMSSKFFYFFI